MAMRDVVALVESLAGAIDHAADRGVHHGLLHLRDIVVGADTVRMTGFGIAAALAKVDAKLPTRPAYALNAQVPTARQPADIYSLIAMAFEAATGKRLSADNLKDLEEEHGADLRAAFEMRPPRAEDFAAALAGGIGATGAMGAKGATDAKPAPRAPVAPIAPVAPLAPVAPEEDFDLRPDERVDLMDDADDEHPADRVVIEPASPPPPAWSAQPPRALHAAEPEPEPSSSRWPIVVMFLVFAVLTALSVGFFLESPTPAPVAEKEPAVDETSVDVATPALVPPAASASAPTDTAELRRDKPNAPSPTPSRPASGAVRRTQTGSVLIRSTPADADVVVNGKPRGKTPLALRDLELGSYTIRIARDGYVAEERTLELTARRPTTSTTINLRAIATNRSVPGLPTKAVGDASATVGSLTVQSRPSGARVFVNDRLAGATPIAIPGLPAGDATVRIEKDGYVPWTATVRVSAGEQTPVRASLEGK
jgi:hypothetical protein